jgi:hypothetical protein
MCVCMLCMYVCYVCMYVCYVCMYVCMLCVCITFFVARDVIVTSNSFSPYLRSDVSYAQTMPSVLNWLKRPVCVY